MANRNDFSPPSRLVLAERSSAQTINLLDALFRQKRIVILSTILGACLAYVYFQNTKTKYTSTARVMVNQRDSGLVQNTASASNGDDLVNEDVLANHIELLRSRKNVFNALTRTGLMKLPSLVSQLDDDQDVVDYVIENLKLDRGGRGASKAARTMLLEFQHIDPNDSLLVLDCVIQEYMVLIQEQFENSLAIANSLVITQQEKIQQELQEAQQEYVDSRRNAPVLFTGEGSSHVYVEQFKNLSNQLVDLEITESTTIGRLEKASQVLSEYADPEKTMPIEALGVIDTDSLNRLGVFATMRANSSRTSDFQLNQPERLEEAKTQYNQLLRLMLDKQRLESDFGAGHPDVQKLQQEIDLVNKFLQDNKSDIAGELDEPQLTSRQLLGAYIGFLKSELASIGEQQSELKSRLKFAETRARGLVDFELKDELLKSRIDRNQQLFDGLVEQLRTLNIASNVDGYIHELLESPRRGIKVWPKLAIVLAAGLMLGLMGGLFAGLVNDQMISKFHTAQEIDNSVSLPVLGYVDRLPIGRRRCIVDSSSTESEAFRMLRTTLLTDVRAGRLSTITATSPSPSDGKSTILLNIAASFASLQIPVVIVEADMRRPTLKKRMRLENKFGLSDVLMGRSSVEQALCSTEVDGLQVIHAGIGTTNPAELLQSEVFDSLLKELKSDFVLTIVDVGPILAVSDPLVVAKKVDGTMLIVRPSVDTRQQVLGAAERLRSGNVNLLGLVVNTYGSAKNFHDGRYGYGVPYSAAPVLETV